MNTKKNKNKQKQKPPNPQPKLETETQIEKKDSIEFENVQEKIEPVKIEERVPEIVSDIPTPASDIKVTEGDTPKKPKRNRGKKKKTEKEDDFDDVLEQNIAKESIEEVKASSDLKESKPIDVVEEKTTDVPEMTPAARKKKNKNKKHPEQSVEKPDQEIRIVPIKSGDELTDVKIVTCVPIITDTSEESKSEKKKNKKKKRNDSERSNKGEEVISCTSAFQKLLENKEDNKEVKLGENKPITEATVTKVDEELIKDKETVKLNTAVEDKTKEAGGKSKKKNKKDKFEDKLEDKEEIPKLSSECILEKDIAKSESVEEDKNKVSEKDQDGFGKKKSKKVEEKKPIEEVKECVKEEVIKSTTQCIQESVQQDITAESATKDESQDKSFVSKKKSKKDKNQPKLESDDAVQKPTEGKQPILEEKSRIEPNIIATNIDIFTEVTKESEQKVKEVPIEKEKSPRPKAKIAKPVEKKPKSKTDTSSFEDLSNKGLDVESLETPVNIEETKATQETIKDQIKFLIDPFEGRNIQTQEKSTGPMDITPKDIKPDIKVQPIVEIKETETITLPESGMGKKRKKSPKPRTPEPTKGLTDLQSDTKPFEFGEVKKGDSATATEATLQKEKVEVTKETETFETKTSTYKEPEKNIPIPLGFGMESLVGPTPVKILSTPDIDKMTEAQKDNVFSESKQKQIDKLPMPASMDKKRKKSPKLPRKFEKSPESFKDMTESTQAIPLPPPPPPLPQDIQEERQEKNENIADMPTLEDIEIRSIKAEESEGSSCDIVPDITYPRASSQLLDTNNNTIIRDVTTSDVKSNIPIALPDKTFMQSSSESPLAPPELLTETKPSVSKHEQKDSKSTDKDFKSIKSEDKTDLKSRVLDVNQGMEELRKSIERSLAEFTAMEKSEKDAEEQFAKAQSKLEQITEMATKKIESCKKNATKPENVPVTRLELREKQIKDEKSVTPDQKVEQVQTDKPLEKTRLETIKQELAVEIKPEETKTVETLTESPLPSIPPVCPVRKDNKGKSKKKKGKHESEQSYAPSTATSAESSPVQQTTTTNEAKESTKDTSKEDKTEQNTDTSQEKGKQQAASFEDEQAKSDAPNEPELTESVKLEFDPIEDFEDALTSSLDDVNKTFEMIANDANQCDQSQNPEINITAPSEDDEKGDTKDQDKINPVSQPKNLLGHPAIPARLNKTDYKKERNKPPNTRQAKVKIKDSVPIEVSKESKESQTENKRRFLKDKSMTETISSVVNENEEYIYKYSFRKVFLPSACHVCKKDLKKMRVPCNFCNLLFYCSPKHKDEDYPHHQALCFAVSTIGHLKDQKHIYGDAQNVSGQDYRLLRMQMILSCEKVLKRRLVPWEQEALLYPRMCSEVSCREWRQGKLADCEGCGQVSYCSDNPSHLPKTHQRWCKSYSLYHKLVVYQQTKGRLEPRLPTRVMAELYQIPEKLNEVLASMFEEKIDMTDIQYATLTQIATAPLTAAYCQQLYTSKMNCTYANGMHKKSAFTIHVVGAELQFEADALNKWEVFFLHLRPDIKDLRVVLVGPDLNPSRLPLDLLGKIKLCENCRLNKRRVMFEFQDKKSYYEYWSTEFTSPDLVCAFNPSIQRSSVFNGKDTWPATIKCIIKLKIPFIITSYTMTELQRDLARIKQCADMEVSIISEAKFNAFASVRPDRNFISDDEMPLLFKNFCFSVVCGAI